MQNNNHTQQPMASQQSLMKSNFNNPLQSPSRKNLLQGQLTNNMTTQSLQQTQQDKRIIQRLMQLQGQCKIKQWQFLKFNLIKSIILMVILILSVIGLFVLKYSVSFRKFVFYNSVTSNQATHIYILGNDKNRDICKIQTIHKSIIYFEYKKLKYSISKFNNQKPIPTAYQLQRQFISCFNIQKLKKGLTSQQVQKRRQLYGPNQHLVQTPSYIQYVLDVLTQPFFLLQYFFCFIFIIQGYLPFSIALIAFSLITTTINYIMLYISYKKIKEIAEKVIQVNVMRNGQIVRIKSRQLVAGDVYIPEVQQQIVADCIVGYGDIYVNQANLTGQSFPIGKFKIQNLSDIKNSSMWVYEGSKTLQIKAGNTFAVVINTGFTTQRGRIIRKILNRTVKDPDILRTTLIFVLEVAIVSIITFFCTLFLLLQRDIEKLFIFFKFIDFLASSVPPPLPIYFNLAYSFSLFRLAYRGIIGTEPQKTVDGAQIKTFCFDKTGTLTRNDVSIAKVFSIQKNQKFQMHNIITQLGKQKNNLIWQLFATCHTTKLINDQLLGDQIDKQMFNFINAKMQTTDDPNIRLVVKNTKQFRDKNQDKNIQLGKEQQDIFELEKQRYSLIHMKIQHHLQVLRINQFQSRFQSMSVLVRDVINNKYFIFAKGSPEKMLSKCSNIITGSDNSKAYMQMLKTLSLNGFRTIGMAYKQLKLQEVQQYLQIDREQYLQGIINLGLIAFQNRLKVDTWLTINRLIKSNIQPKMITGDNIYIAVQTARRAGILGIDQKVVFLQGNRNNRNSVIIKEPQGQFSRIFEGTIIDKIQQDVKNGQTSNFTEHVIHIHQKKDYLKGQFTFAVDNSFLTMNPPPLLSHSIKVFARIPPQNKAFIIRQYKKQHNEYIRTHYSKFIRWLKVKKWKIGMCGDGANDLLALRQADLSIGIQATDASYGSSFTVNNMLDVDWVIKQSKCTQANIIQLYQTYATTSLFLLICSILLLTDQTYFSTIQLMYLNFGTILLIPGTIAMSRPDSSQSQHVPDANMMGLHNHLIFWGNLLIPFGGVLGCWFYYTNTSQYQPNPQPKVQISSGFNSKNYSTTLIFILVLIVTACNGFIIYRSKPWRQRFYKNYLFTFLIVANLAIALIFAFLTKQLQHGLQFQPISLHHMGICMGIIFGSLILNWIYNIVIGKFKLDHKTIVLEKQQARLVSMIQRHGKKTIKDSMIMKNIQGK